MDAKQLALHDLPERDITFWQAQARTASFSERDILRWIIELFNRGEAFDADVTYSLGQIWDDLPQPRFRFDLKPQAPRTITSDCRLLPLPNASLKSLMFDPPFNVRNSVSPMKLHRDWQKTTRFGVFPSKDLLFSFYADSIAEFARVLKPRGILVVKIQDCVDSGTRLWSSDHIIRCAEAHFELIERFVLIADSIVWRAKPKYHARAAHCFYLVFGR